MAALTERASWEYEVDTESNVVTLPMVRFYASTLKHQAALRWDEPKCVIMSEPLFVDTPDARALELFKRQLICPTDHPSRLFDTCVGIDPDDPEVEDLNRIVGWWIKDGRTLSWCIQIEESGWQMDTLGDGELAIALCEILSPVIAI